NLRSAREVERRLAVATAGVHDLRIGRDEGLQSVQHAESRCSVCVYSGAALDEECGELRIAAIEHAEAAGPPVAASVDVGAVVQQQVDHLAVLRIDGGQ